MGGNYSNGLTKDMLINNALINTEKSNPLDAKWAYDHMTNSHKYTGPLSYGPYNTLTIPGYACIGSNYITVPFYSSRTFKAEMDIFDNSNNRVKMTLADVYRVGLCLNHLFNKSNLNITSGVLYMCVITSFTYTD